MVDFNNEATVTTPSAKLLQILALEKRENLLLAVEFYYKNKFTEQDKGTELGIIKSNLWLLYYELMHMIKRKKKEDEIKALKAKFDSDNEKEVLSAVEELNNFMDDLHLIKIDNKQVYDSTNTELENELKEL